MNSIEPGVQFRQLMFDVTCTIYIEVPDKKKV